MKQIVVALDGSAFARQALAWALELTKGAPEKARFHLVHAYQAPVPVAASAHAFAHAWERAREAGQQLVAETRAHLAGLDAEIHLVEDAPAAAVLQVAKQVKADLIAVGRRGLDPAASLLLGSVSTALLHRSYAPALVVHDAPPRTLKSILVGVDDSPHSARALAFAAAWAPDAAITALHVTSAAAEEGEAIIHRTAQQAGINPERLQPLVQPGSPVETVVTTFRSGGYDLAVVGSRGLGTMGELLLGSVSERLSRLAHGAVVVVK